MRLPSPSLSRTQSMIGALTLLTAALMLCLDGTRDGDLYLQLASGRFVATHGFSAVDPFLTIAHGEPWLNQQWLTELLVYRIVHWVGVTGLTVVYAALLATPLALLLWLCRRKGFAMMIALAALYCPGLWVVVHPRAAGFSVLAFSLLVSIVVVAWLRPRSRYVAARRLRWAVPATLLLFALWVNLHGGFVAGLLLLGILAAGLALERRLGMPTALGRRRIALAALTAVLAALTVTVATPLGGSIWSYLLSFRNPAIALVSSEWQPAFRSPLAIAYLGAAGAFVAWLWWKTRSSTALTPVLVAACFLLFGLLALRNIVFVGPAIALLVAAVAPDRETRIPRRLIAAALAAASLAGLIWVATVGPARNESILNPRLVEYALDHPPRSGHIAAYAGIGSYMLWRSPQAPVELDGWLEHFSAAQLRGTYAILDGRLANPMPYVRRLRIGAAIVDRRKAIRVLRAHGFTVRFRTSAGAYLVRQGER
jgi:hypothetical protein